MTQAARPEPRMDSGTKPRTALESPTFPFEHISEIAAAESWRKEVNRPIYHLHKWWAQRLGSVFRAILIGALSPEGEDVLAAFYSPVKFPRRIVFDPFMGSGTTVGEALKLGARAIGRDINPVAELAVRSALRAYSREDVLREFQAVEYDVADKIKRFYSAKLEDGTPVDVLYYFWVKWLPCPHCGSAVDLFSSYIFSRHAYPKRYPLSRAVCPRCGAINEVRYDATEATCHSCDAAFNPQQGPVTRQKATCPECRNTFPVARIAKELGRPPEHRMYAKMVLLPGGQKRYLAADHFDASLYAEAAREAERRRESLPEVPIEPGYNTNQVLNYGYTSWHQMFNSRQLLCIGMLFERLRRIDNAGVRQLLEVHLSGVLEFNNMFASFKGEGTGAVRHMFSHHILKPERTPLEANLWGTPKSSGSFSTLFRSRVLRALDYREDPFELRVSGEKKTVKVYGLSNPLGHDPAQNYADFTAGKVLYLSCGDSSETDIAPNSVDLVVTDPPFFDNVHYSQLADFFYVWLQRAGYDITDGRGTTRSDHEVQHTDANEFASRLSAVYRECHRVLRPNGLLVFTYHHSRDEGWHSVIRAVIRAGFYITATQPVKAEMSVAAPKSQASEPIDLDIIIICRKRGKRTEPSALYGFVLADASAETREQIARFNATGRKLSRNDVRVVLMAQLAKRLSVLAADDAEAMLGQIQVGETIEALHAEQLTRMRGGR